MKKFTFLLLFSSLVAIGNAATFTSNVVTGDYSTPSSWSVAGPDADGIPDATDNVVISAGNTITLTTTGIAKTLTINSGGVLNMNNNSLLVYGDMTNNGTTQGNGSWQFRATGTYTGNNLPNNGYIYFYADYVIAASVVINKPGSIVVAQYCNVTNNGSISLSNAGILHLYIGSTWVNAVNSAVSVSGNCINNGTINASANPNTFTFANSTCTSIIGNNATYYNLTMTSASAVTKSLNSNLTVLNRITIGANVTFNWANNNISIGGNWVNNASINCQNMGTITFNGSGVQTINRTATERFNNVILSGSATIQLNQNLLVIGTTTINSGTLNPNTFVYQQRGASWVTNGGTINTGASGRIAFVGITNQTIGGTISTTFGNLEINAPGFSVTCNLTEAANGTTTLTAGTLNPNTFTFVQNGASWLSNGGVVNSAASGMVSFQGSSPQTIGGSATATFGNLQINSSSTVTLAVALDVNATLTLLAGTLDVSASSFAVNIAGNFVHTGGTFTAQSGTVTFDGSAAQTCSGVATVFNNITSDNSLGGVGVTGIAVINGILQVNNNSFGTSGGGNIILTATGPTTYAKIGPLGAAASLSGTSWTVNAYIDGPATAYWQYLGSPVSGSTIADWDNDTRFYMSGVGGNDGTACCPTFYSVRTYNSTTGAYANVTSTSTALTPGRGFMVWMADNTSQLTAPLPYDTKGTPNFGTVLRTVTAGGPSAGYNLVSNPYACPIDYAAVVANSGNLNSNFLILLENGSYATNPNGGTIAPNQGFMAIATITGSMKFGESTKTVVANPNILRNGDPENFLRIKAGNSVNGLGGEAVVQIHPDARNGQDIALDMPYLASPYDDATNIWTSDKEDENLLLNALDGTADKLDIPLTVKSGTPGEQLLTFKGLNGFTAYSCAWLEDLATGEKINLKEHDTYAFNAELAGEKHDFNLHFERDGNCPLNEQAIAPSLDASSLVYVNNGNILVQFGFDEKSAIEVTVLNVAGQEVTAPKNMTVTNETIALDSPGAHGIYLVRITRGDEVVTKKIYY